jgi:hypothetical protein
MSASYIFAALPVIALGAVAVLGYFWLREPVTEARTAARGAGDPQGDAVLASVAEAIERVSATTTQLAATLADKPRRAAARPAAAKAAAPKPAARKPAAKAAAARKPASRATAAKTR